MSATASVFLGDDEKQGAYCLFETACEPINEWLCITPAVAGVRGDDIAFSGGFVVTHIPSGWTASRGAGCIECTRYLGGVLARLDWATAPTDINQAAYTAWLDEQDPEVVDLLREMLDLSWFCSAEVCESRVAVAS